MDRLSVLELSTRLTHTALPGAFRVAHGVDDARRDHVIVTVTARSGTSGRTVTGVGEASPLTFFTGETVGSVAHIIEAAFAPLLLAGGDRGIADVISDLEHRYPGHPAALAGLDMALHDAVSRAWGVGLDAILGTRHDRVPVYKAIGIGTVEQSARDAEHLVGRGFRALKVKVGLDVASDLARLAAIRAAVGEDIHICADANAGYGVAEAVRFARSANEYDLAYLEQPVAKRDIRGLRTVREQGGVPIMADEALHDLRDAVELLARGAVDLFGLKLVKTGGLWRARQLAALAEAHGVRCVVISPFDSSIGAAANVLLAASLPGPLLPQGLGTTVVATGDDGPQLTFEDGKITVPRGVGLDLAAPQELSA